jgi:DNA-binding response OmpR family regulator
MTERLLVVDDDEFVRALMEEMLGQCGYAVSTAEDGQVAWEALERDPAHYDLILLDKQMPRLDGISLLRRIRGDGRFADLPVIMLTADTSPEDVSEGLAAGAHYYLTKPSSEDVLKVVIKSALTESRQKLELRALAGRHAGSLGLLCRAEFRCRTLAEAKDLALLLADASMDPSRTVVGYSELLINAVEHGNLGISYADKSRLLGEGRWAEEVEQRLHNPDFADRVVTVMLEKADGNSQARQLCPRSSRTAVAAIPWLVVEALDGVRPAPQPSLRTRSARRPEFGVVDAAHLARPRARCARCA